MDRPLDVISEKDGKEKMPNSTTIGENRWQLVSKFANPDTQSMSSTKILHLQGHGCLVETKHIEPNGLSSSMVFVPVVTPKDFGITD